MDISIVRVILELEPQHLALLLRLVPRGGSFAAREKHTSSLA